jgi:hypothetical protein
MFHSRPWLRTALVFVLGLPAAPVLAQPAQTPTLLDTASALLASSPSTERDEKAADQTSSGSALPRVGEVAGTRIGGFLVGSYSYNSRIHMVPEFAGGSQALTAAGDTNFRFDKFGIGAFRTFGPYFSAQAAVEVERHRDAHSHGFAPAFGCPGTAPCIERFGAETPVTEAVLDRFSVTARIPVGNGLYASVGRFDVPFGLEKHDEPLNVTATTSELFQFARAQRMTGAQVNYVFSPVFDVNVWWVNRWESETTHTPFDDNNGGKTLGARFGITPYSRDRLLNIGAGFIYGPEKNLNDDDHRWIFDVDFVAAPTPDLFVGGEFVIGAEERVSFRRRGEPFPQPAVVNQDVSWSSGYVLAHHDPLEWLGLNFRYGFINDDDGARTGVIQTLQSITLGPLFHLSALDPDSGTTGAAYGRTRHRIHWLDLKLEYRYNFSDQRVFSAMLPSVDITDATRNSHQVQLQFVLNF